MDRVLEPELMDDEEQALAYAVADFAGVNAAFVDRFRALFPAFARGSVADLGCGPADIPIRLCRALSKVRVTAIDGATAMLVHAARAVAEARLSHRIQLVHGILPGAIDEPKSFDAVISNSLLHHLESPGVLWSEIRRLGRQDAAVLVVDLLRPDSKESAHAIVETYAANEHPILKSDFFNSLCAAFTLDEVRIQLDRAGLGHLDVASVSDRHLAVSGRLPD